MIDLVFKKLLKRVSELNVIENVIREFMSTVFRRKKKNGPI